MDEKHLRKLLQEFKAGRKDAEAVLAELKAYGKRLGGGRFVADRRRVHDGEAAWALRQQQDRGIEH